MSATVRVVQYGHPPRIHAVLHDAAAPAQADPEVLADDLPGMEAGTGVAEARLRERGARVGLWRPIGPCVREALVFRGGA